MNSTPSRIVYVLLVALLAATDASAQDEKREEAHERKGPAELAPEKLPERTRARPDPAKQQFALAPVYVEIKETMKLSDLELRTPDVPVMENYFKEYLRRAGHPIVTSPEEAEYRVEGTLHGFWHQDVVFLRRTIAYEVRGSSTVKVLDRDGALLESFDTPETSRVNVRSEESGFLDLERYVAMLQWEKVYREGKVFGQPAVVGLLRSLTERPTSDNPNTETVVAKLADLGLGAVPLLVESLTDTRTVRLRSSYPGIERHGRDGLKVYHIADKALEEIFQKVSRMGLDTSDKHRFLIMKGWENEWRRFCPPFRDSPEGRRGRGKESTQE